MKRTLLVIAGLFFMNLGKSQEITPVKYNTVDSTYIISASGAAKLAYLAEKGIYIDTLIKLNNQLYELLGHQNEELSEVYTEFDNFKMDSDAYNKTVNKLQNDKMLFYAKQAKSNKKWKWFWIISSVLLTGTLIIN